MQTIKQFMLVDTNQPLIKKSISLFSIILMLLLINQRGYAQQQATVLTPGVKKIKDLLIYQDTLFYSAFPSVIKNKEGEIIVAFRRAPERRRLGEKSTPHVDPNSYLVAVTSRDGENWTKEPKLLYAHPFGGSQDPCMLQLKDGTILCASYGWAFLSPDEQSKLKKPYFKGGKGTFLGGYLIRSTDAGRSWSAPIYPPHVPSEINYNAYGNPVAAYNRGSLYEGKNGRIYWIVAATDTEASRKTSNYLLISDDKGLSWKYTSEVAKDDKIGFNEASVYETPKGDIVAFLRSANFQDEGFISRSTDHGKTFKWESMGFKGHPFHALRLPDNRVLLTYGYRHAPFGIRARILNPECTDFRTAPEFILRNDGGGFDLGYPWAVQLDKKRVLVAYYFNKNDGPRHIDGTILEIDSSN